MSKVTVADTRGLSGLSNTGNTCYMNAVLQCLSNHPKMTLYFLEYDSKKGAGKPKKYDDFLNCYIILIREMWRVNSMLKPTSFKKSLNFHHQKYDNKSQHDAHEFLLDTLTMLDDSVSKKHVEVLNELTSTHWIKSRKAWKSTFDGKKSFITDEFFGQYITRFKCNSCQEDYFKYDPFCCIYLTLRDPREEYPLQFLIDKYFDSDYFNVTCQRECNIDRKDPEDQLKPEHEVSSKIIHLPETLIFVIKRYDNIGGKIKSKVTINETITLDKHFHNISNEPVIYNFKSTVFHDGDTIDSGHYYSCIKRKSGYKIFDDTKIFGVEDINTIDQASSYILFYERAKN